MLRRVVGLSQGVAASTSDTADADATLPPSRTLDGYGRLGTPPATATPVSAASFDTTPVSPRHPPGLYGPIDAPRAINLANADLKLKPLGALTGVSSRPAFRSEENTSAPQPIMR